MTSSSQSQFLTRKGETSEKMSFETIPDEPDWWETFVKEQYPDEKCQKYFRCSRKTYIYLVKSLKSYVAPRAGSTTFDSSKSYMGKGVCAEKQVAILLYKLTSCVDYMKMSRKFKIHKTTIHKIIYRSIVAINKYLLHKIIKMPKNEDAEAVAADFEHVHEIPQILGVMSVIHIPVCSPINLNYKFLNSLLYPSFVLQAIMDSNCLFRDISVRHTGAVEPQNIIADSNIYKYSEKVLPTEKKSINGVDMSYKIISPKNGPSYPWLLNDYKPESTVEEAIFNRNLNDIRGYGDTVISRLRSRFPILCQMLDLSYKVVPQVIGACCVIHNICEVNDDPFFEEWLLEADAMLRKYPQPDMNFTGNEIDSQTLFERDVLKDYVNSKTIEIEASFLVNL
ncbi:putative nuclease HARBI1 [Trichogramma pretiosum]|uniref:putative nuclease HARBI1 n=1 Tax=Trichogramma pretiosum TaxID=7493 RepID=UPI0006C9C1AF|nr:putative nuclease HARBI1 [Trichogramma pretiosum]